MIRSSSFEPRKFLPPATSTASLGPSFLPKALPQVREVVSLSALAPLNDEDADAERCFSPVWAAPAGGDATSQDRSSRKCKLSKQAAVQRILKEKEKQAEARKKAEIAVQHLAALRSPGSRESDPVVAGPPYFGSTARQASQSPVDQSARPSKERAGMYQLTEAEKLKHRQALLRA